MREKLWELGYKVDENTGCPVEPSPRVRREARLALRACGPDCNLPVPIAPRPTEGPDLELPTPINPAPPASPVPSSPAADPLAKAIPESVSSPPPPGAARRPRRVRQEILASSS